MDLNDINNIEKKELNIDLENIQLEDKPKKEIIREDPDNIVFSVKDSVFDLPLRITEFESSKDLDRFVKYVEKIIRLSSEYKYWINYITEALGHNACSFTYEKISECKVDIHHHPITLYSICKAVINKKLDMDKSFCTFDIATEVIELHFKNKVGYIPLLSNLHEKYHKGFLPIPIEFVHGDYNSLLNEYSFEDDDLDRICDLKSVTKEQCQNHWNIETGYPSLTGTD